MLDSPDEIGRAFETMESAHADAVIVQGTFATKEVADLAIKHHLAAATNFRSFAEAGGLLSYGYQGTALYKQMAGFVQKIFEGNKPADIPVEQPSKFELVINLRTARTLGLTVTPMVLGRADEVIV
jgi:putative ABC transport system substrate-binding protein